MYAERLSNVSHVYWGGFAEPFRKQRETSFFFLPLDKMECVAFHPVWWGRPDSEFKGL